MIRLKRVYEKPAAEDGFRVLVERLWPRGMRKEEARVVLWLREAGASTELRKWFGHDPAKWEEFQEEYFRELSEKPEVVHQLINLLRENTAITFLFAARDEEHNNAVALKRYLEERAV